MEFAINYNEGYEVCVIKYYEPWGRKRFYPIRNFGEHQGDAILYKISDCPNLSDSEINLLIKTFQRNRKYKRISSHKFKIEKQ